VSATARRLLLIVAAVALAAAAGARARPLARPREPKVDVKFEQLQGFNAPGTPAKYKQGRRPQDPAPSDAKNHPRPRARYRPRARPTSSRWRRTIVPRVEGLAGLGDRAAGRTSFLEDHSVLNQAKKGKAHRQAACSTTYLGFRHRPQHHEAFPIHPGQRRRLRTRLGHERRRSKDMRRVVEARPRSRAAGRARRATLLGGSITASVPQTWDFQREAGCERSVGPWFSSTAGAAPRRRVPTRRNLQLCQALPERLAVAVRSGGIPAPVRPACSTRRVRPA